MRHFPLVAIALTLALLSCGQTPPANQNSSPETPSTAVTAQSPGTIVINGKTLVPAGKPCELPQAFANDELLNRILTVPIGASPDEAQQQVGKPPDQPLITYQNTGTANLGTLIWTDKRNPTVLEMRLEFKEGKLVERIVLTGENVGQENEKICSWRSQD